VHLEGFYPEKKRSFYFIGFYPKESKNHLILNICFGKNNFIKKFSVLEESNLPVLRELLFWVLVALRCGVRARPIHSHLEFVNK